MNAKQLASIPRRNNLQSQKVIEHDIYKQGLHEVPSRPSIYLFQLSKKSHGENYQLNPLKKILWRKISAESYLTFMNSFKKKKSPI